LHFGSKSADRIVSELKLIRAWSKRKVSFCVSAKDLVRVISVLGLRGDHSNRRGTLCSKCNDVENRSKKLVYRSTQNASRKVALRRLDCAAGKSTVTPPTAVPSVKIGHRLHEEGALTTLENLKSDCATKQAGRAFHPLTSCPTLRPVWTFAAVFLSMKYLWNTPAPP
jgi:hypothetical protein